MRGWEDSADMDQESTTQSVVAGSPHTLGENEFRVSELAPGQITLVQVEGDSVAVYNVDGMFYATQGHCAHAGWPLNDAELSDEHITCPWHGWCFNVTNGQVVRGAPNVPLRTYRITIEHGIGRVTS
jgi:nitrite reductase/ring-hydroxylating ferredoxin subunit